MPKLIRCKQGHVFDASELAACPVCGDPVVVPAPVDPAPTPGPTPPRPRNLILPLAGAVVAGALLLGAALLWRSQKSDIPTPDDLRGHMTGAKTRAPEADKSVDGAATRSKTAQGPAEPPTSARPPAVEPAAPPIAPPLTPSPTASPGPAPTPAPTASPTPATGDSPIVAPSATPSAAPAVAPTPSATLTPSSGPSPTADDPRDPRILQLETQYAFSALTRELLATAHGFWAEGRSDYPTALAWTNSPDTRDNPVALFHQGQMLAYGGGVRANAAEGLSKIHQAADAGYYYAQVRLAEIYLHAPLPGVPADRDQALFWALKAGLEGRKEANDLLAELSVPPLQSHPNMADFDQEIGRSFANAFGLARQIAESGDGAANYWLGTLLLGGHGVGRDAAAGRVLLTKAARLFNPPAMAEIAQAIFDGELGPKNPVEALTVLYIAAGVSVWDADTKMVNDYIRDYLPALSPAEYRDLGVLLKGVRDLSGAPAK